MNNRYTPQQPSTNGQQAYPQQAGSSQQANRYASQPAMSNTLDKVPLGTDEENSKLLDLVDRLRECRVDRFIDLPQVVVVGDQSSGKSSVLEAISQIPFPRASIACTRFATQIRLRRDQSLNSTITKVAIRAQNPRDQQRYDSFAHTVDTSSDFAEIFNRASELIFSGGSRDFLSRDILTIERTGPNLPHLTIVDLPGIIHNPTKTQTVRDVEAIAQLSWEYMSKDRTIILPIVGCDSEYARQIVIRRCKEADPNGIRTLGIITKPDMTLTPEREAEFIDLACNRDERNRLELGWHVLRNRAFNEMDATTNRRDEEERSFFAKSRWGSQLEPNQLGVDALRKRLSTQLIRHIATEVFKVQSEIERLLNDCNGKLREMGPGLETIEQMRQELSALCKRSGSLTREAVQGHGINPLGEDFFPRYNDNSKTFSRNLRSRVVIMNEAFNDNMEKHGAQYSIKDVPGGVQRSPTSNTRSNSQYTPREITRKEFIEREVQPLIRDNPGQELSVDINPRLVYRLFQSYSVNWPRMADDHVRIVQRLCEEFLTEVMNYAWPQRLRSRVWRSFVQQAIEERLTTASKELNELKKDRFRNIRTYHSSFEKNYYTRASGGKESADSMAPTNKYEDTLRKMLLHYEHQLPTFISNVITQVIERHLVDGMEEIFEGDRIHKLSDAQVRQMMEEESTTRIQRKEIRDQQKVLQDGLDICREIAGRNDLGPYERREPALAPEYDTYGPSGGDRGPSPTPVRNPFANDSYSTARKPIVSFDDDAPAASNRYSSSSGYNATNGSSSLPPPPPPADPEDEDAQLQRAIEESKRDAESQRYASPALPSRPAPQADDDGASVNQQRSRRRLFQGLGR